MKTYTIYGLVDSRTFKIIYVGCTSDIIARYKNHSTRFHENRKPLLKILLITTTLKKAIFKELFYIKKYRKTISNSKSEHWYRHYK